MRYLYKYPQAPFPLRGSRRDQPPALARRSRVRADRYRRVRRRQLLRCLRRIREGRPRGSADRDHRHSTAGRSRRPFTCCRRSGSGTPGGNANVERPIIRVAAGRGAGLEAVEPIAGQIRAALPGAAPSCCSSTTRPIRSAGATERREQPRRGALLLQGRNQRIPGRRARGVDQPAAGRHQGVARYVRVEIPPRRQPFAAPAPDERGRARSATADDETALGTPFAKVMEARKREADEFYATVIPASLSEDRRRVMRQSLAGMLWSKQFYDYDVDAWLADHGDGAVAPGMPQRGRNADWSHMVSDDVISMPGQVGVPVVRGLGSRLPRDSAVARRSRLRQEAAPAAAAGALPAPERAGAGLRVELRRRQPAGSRVGRLLPLPDRPAADRPRRSSSSSSASTTSCC